MSDQAVKSELRLRFRSAAHMQATLERLMNDRPGVSGRQARDASIKCANAVFGNAYLTGAMATVILGLSSRNVVAGLEAGIGVGTIVGLSTLAFGQACEPFNLSHLLDEAIMNVAEE